MLRAVKPYFEDKGIRAVLGDGAEDDDPELNDGPNPLRYGGMRESGIRAHWPLDAQLEAIFRMWGRATWVHVPGTLAGGSGWHFRDEDTETEARETWGVEKWRDIDPAEFMRDFHMANVPDKAWKKAFNLCVHAAGSVNKC